MTNSENKKPKVILYQPCHTSMQSGVAKSNWCLKFENYDTRFKEPVMGWTANTDMKQEITLNFPDLASAQEYLDKHDIDYEIIMPDKKKLIPKSYADNFQ